MNRSNPGPAFLIPTTKKEMHRIATTMSRTEFYTAMFLATVFTIIIAAGYIGIMFWRLNAKYGADPSKTPMAVFFFYLASASIATLAGGLPFSDPWQRIHEQTVYRNARFDS